MLLLEMFLSHLMVVVFQPRGRSLPLSPVSSELIFKDIVYLKFYFPGLAGGAVVYYTPAVATQAYTLLSRKDSTKMCQ